MPPASTTPSQFISDHFRLFDGQDITKKSRFVLSGITSGNTRSLTIPNQDGVISLEGHTHPGIGGVVHVQLDNLTDKALYFDTPGDNVERFKIQINGKIEWGPGGSGAVDTNLYRSEANVLKTDDVFYAAGALFSGAVEVNNYLYLNKGADLRFFNDTDAHFVGFEAPAGLTASSTWKLPTGDGSDGQVLQTDGSKNLSWKTLAVGAGGADTQIQFNDSGVLSGTSKFTIDKTDGHVFHKANVICKDGWGISFYDSDNSHYSAIRANPTTTQNRIYYWPIADGSNGQILQTNGSGVLSWAANANTPAGDNHEIQYNASGALGADSDLKFYYDSSPKELYLNAHLRMPTGQEIRMYESGGSNYVGWKAPLSITSDTIYTIPQDGSNAQCLITNGSGTLSWAGHDNLAGFEAGEHFLQTAITNVSTALSTGLLKVTTGTGALSVITDNSGNWDTAFSWGDHAGLYDAAGTAAGLISSHESTYDHDSYDVAYTHSQLTSGNPHNVTKSEVGLGNVENIALSTWAGSANITTLGTITTGVWEATDVGIAHGGTGQSTQQNAINALTNVSGATNEHVLTKDTASGNAIFKAAAGGTPGGADTNVQFNDGGSFGGDSALVWNKTSDYLGIGVTPSYRLHVVHNTANPQMVIASNLVGDFEVRTHHNTPGNAAFLSYRRSRGTAASPSANSAGDVLGIFNAIGYTNIYETAARVEFGCDAGWGPTNPDAPGYIYFKTSPDGSSTPVTRLSLKASGYVGIGTESPGCLLHVYSASPTFRIERTGTGGGYVDQFISYADAGNYGSLYIQPSTANAQFNFRNNGSGLVFQIDTENNKLYGAGTLFLAERAAAISNIAGQGQFWVVNATPCVPKFADDAGTEFSLAMSDHTTGGSGSAGSGNQYVELNIGGTTYKVLHDGTV